MVVFTGSVNSVGCKGVWEEGEGGIQLRRNEMVNNVMVCFVPCFNSSQLSFPFQIGSKIISHRNPDPAEYRIQAMSVIAACGKGLMYFQSTVSIHHSTRLSLPKVLMMNVLDDCPKLEHHTMHAVICKQMMQTLDGKARKGRESGQRGRAG